MVVGILGGGQLARMMALAGYPLGMKFIVLEPAKDACASPVAEQLVGAYDDEALLAQLAEKADVVTYEFENVPAKAVEFLTGKIDVYPPAQALAVAQDRLNEKTMFRELGIPTPEFAPIDSLEDLQQAMATIGYPAVLKTRREGYDGKGQAVLRCEADLENGWQAMYGKAAIVEAFVHFDREVSVIAVRDREGHTRCYPMTENTHRDGILRQSIARAHDAVEPMAHDYITRLLDKMEYVGVLALELFQDGDHLLANECAPRVHNSGHWTQNGAVTCQFENHIRAITGLPLGSTESIGHAGMVNLIGDVPESCTILEDQNAHLHLYGKDSRPGRKIGHVNIQAMDQATFKAALEKQMVLADKSTC
jgi:5-(carboxyamino)imidazole ribonucleotide synthase